MNVGRLVGAIAAALGTVFLIIAHVTPWGGVHESFAGASVKADAYVWEAKSSFSGFGAAESESHSWYHDDFDDDDGVGQLRAGGPLLAVTLGLLALGAVLQFVVRSPVAPAITLLAVAVGVAGIIVFSLGVRALFDDEQSWSVAFAFAIVAVCLGALGGILGLLPDGKLPRFTSKGGASY